MPGTQTYKFLSKYVFYSTYKRLFDPLTLSMQKATEVEDEIDSEIPKGRHLHQVVIVLDIFYPFSEYQTQ